MRNAVVALLIALILFVMVGLLVPAIVKVREAAARMQCSNNLKQLGLAMHNYNGTFTKFPKAAMPNPDLPLADRLSWIVDSVPYIEANNLFNKMDKEKGWDAEENRFATLMVLKYLQCPGHSDRRPVSTLAPSDYVGIAGIGANAADLPLKDDRAGFFGYERALTVADLNHRGGEILMLAETSQVSGAWTAAGPPTTRGLEPSGPAYLGSGGQFGGNHPHGANTVFADGSVRFVENSIDPALWEAMATIGGKGNRE